MYHSSFHTYSTIARAERPEQAHAGKTATSQAFNVIPGPGLYVALGVQVSPQGLKRTVESRNKGLRGISQVQIRAWAVKAAK